MCTKELVDNWRAPWYIEIEDYTRRGVCEYIFGHGCCNMHSYHSDSLFGYKNLSYKEGNESYN